jgi:hypothetical protein
MVDGYDYKMGWDGMESLQRFARAWESWDIYNVSEHKEGRSEIRVSIRCNVLLYA